MLAIQAGPKPGILAFLRAPRFGAKVGQGAKVRMWKQDPTVHDPGIRTVYIPTPIQPGPKDEFVKIMGMPAVAPDADGNFLYDPQQNPQEFDSVDAFAAVRQTVTMVQRALKRMGVQKEFTWQWGKGTPVSVYPHAGDMANAYYSRGEKAIKFFYFESPKDKSRIYTTRSFDIKTHETGHAILDGLQPGFLSSWHPQTGGLHESFGDLMDIFSMLAQLDMCEAVIAESRGDLHDKTFFNALAEQFGDALGREFGLRNADNKLKLSDVSTEVHDISQVFTGAMYDILADMFESGVRLDREDPAHTLFKTGDHLFSILMGALMAVPPRNATYKQVAEKMISLEPNPQWKEFIRKRFTEREVLGQAPQTVTPGSLSFRKCCPTLQRREHTRLFNNAIREAKTLGLSMTV